MWRIIASAPLAVQRTRKIVKIEGDAMRLMRFGSAFDKTRERAEPLDQIDFARVFQN